MSSKTRPQTEPKPEFDPKAHAASMIRMRKEERERRERARRKHNEAIARRNAYRERGYREPGEEAADMDDGSTAED